MPNDKHSKISTSTPVFNTEEATASEQIIDWEQAKAVINSDLDEAVMLFRQLLDFIPGIVNKIREAVAANDSVQLLEAVHKLNGACSYSGIPRLKLATKNLESAVRKKDESLIKELAVKLEQEYELLLKAVQADELLNKK